MTKLYRDGVCFTWDCDDTKSLGIEAATTVNGTVATEAVNGTVKLEGVRVCKSRWHER